MTEYVDPPAWIPFLNCDAAIAAWVTQLSGCPNPASDPVSGWIHPIVIDLPELEPEELDPANADETVEAVPPGYRSCWHQGARSRPSRTRRRRPNRTGPAGNAGESATGCALPGSLVCHCLRSLLDAWTIGIRKEPPVSAATAMYSGGPCGP